MPRPGAKQLDKSREAREDEVDDMHDNRSSSPELEMDEDEDELARLVLGDSAGFKEQMGMDMDVDEEDQSNGEGSERADPLDEDGLENMDDADLFFLDSGPGLTNDNTLLAPPEPQIADDAPAWEDSDDDRLAISLANNSRLRKLRVNESEDIVNGREYTRRLRRQYETLNPVPEWAQPRPTKRIRRESNSSLSSSDEDADMDETDISALPLARFLQDARSLERSAPISGKSPKYRPEVINIQRSKDIGKPQPSAVTSLSFHPHFPVLLSSGPASTIYLHHLTPTANPPNPVLTSLHIRHTPLSTTSFHSSGDKIYFSGRRRYFHIWDLPTGTIQKVTRIYGHQDSQRSMERFKLSPCGRYMALVSSSRKGGGSINVLDAHTTQWLGSARIEGRNGIADFAFWADGNGLTIAGKSGEVGEWSIEEKDFVGRWTDDGAFGTTVLALGGSGGPKTLGGDRWVVIGSQSGIVNIYDRRTFSSDPNPNNTTITIPSHPTPTRILSNLTTPISNLSLSPCGQLLVMSSKWKKDSLRLVHLPSCTVYRNWPTSNTPLGRVTATAWRAMGVDDSVSKGKENEKRGDLCLAVANEAGKIRMFDVRC